MCTGSDSKINRDVVGKSRKLSFTEKSALWLRGNIFIPDARKFWTNPSVKFLCNYLQTNPVDAIISTGPPHTDHLIAQDPLPAGSVIASSLYMQSILVKTWWLFSWRYLFYKQASVSD